MKKMKIIKVFLCIFLTLGTALLICGRSNVVHANTHTLHTVTSFGFVDHHAYVNVDFTGYEDAVQIRVDVRIEKQFLFFRQTIHSKSYETVGEIYQSEFFYPIYQDGVYDCTVTYTVTDSEGVEDVITFHDTKSYISDEHMEHTHVWNHERVSPTYTTEGLDRAFCYCGASEETVLEKLTYSYDNGSNKYPSYSSTSYSSSSSYIQSNVTSTFNSSPKCKNGKIFGTPCNLSGKCVGGSCLIPGR